MRGKLKGKVKRQSVHTMWCKYLSTLPLNVHYSFLMHLALLHGSEYDHSTAVKSILITFGCRRYLILAKSPVQDVISFEGESVLGICDACKRMSLGVERFSRLGVQFQLNGMTK